MKFLTKIVLVALFLAGVLTILTVQPANATIINCEGLGSGTIDYNMSISISIAPCNTIRPEPIYFGVCDNGGPKDDLFNIVFRSGVVASNTFASGIENVSIGEATDTGGISGTLVAELNSLNVGQASSATYLYSVSMNRDKVVSDLATLCGTGIVVGTPFSGCVKGVPVFTEDTAPTNGTLTFNVLFGEMNRKEGITTKTWHLQAGQRINNDVAFGSAPTWARLWWQPEGESTWYLLPSQYWHGGGTVAQEYGIACDANVQPSYHTSFEGMIPESQVPVLDGMCLYMNSLLSYSIGREGEQLRANMGLLTTPMHHPHSRLYTV